MSKKKTDVKTSIINLLRVNQEIEDMKRGKYTAEQQARINAFNAACEASIDVDAIADEIRAILANYRK